MISCKVTYFFMCALTICIAKHLLNMHILGAIDTSFQVYIYNSFTYSYIYIIYHLQRLLVLIGRMNLSLTEFDFLLEPNPRALLSLPTRQHLMKHLNIYVLKVVYLPFSGVLLSGHGEGWLTLLFDQCPLLFHIFHFQSR